MALTLTAPDGSSREFRPAAPPRATWRLEAGPPGPRAERAACVADALSGALALSGWEPSRVEGEADLVVAVESGRGARLLIGPVEGEVSGLSRVEFRLLCLREKPGATLLASPSRLEDARRERRTLASAAAALSGVSSEPSSRGYAGYLLRFRGALEKDLDLPEALTCVWDALRPGALSPGSRAAFLRAALPALGLDFLNSALDNF